MLNFFDQVFIRIARSFSLPFARGALFVIFFWFGILKVLGFSPASPLVGDLLNRTLPFIEFDNFIILFGLFEMVIGLSFLIPELIRISIALLAIHMVSTGLPLLLLPTVAWQSFLVPTLEGQYIIKNLVIIAVAMSIVARMHLPSDVHQE